MNAGVVAPVKVRYRSVQIERAVDRMDKNTRDVYRIVFLSAVLLLTRIWSAISKYSIEHCWKHTKKCPLHAEIQSSSPAQETVCTSSDTERAKPGRKLFEDIFVRSRISTAALLNAPGEDECSDILI